MSNALRLQEGEESELQQQLRSHNEDMREEQTWLVVLKLLLLVVVHHNVGLHRDHLLFVKLPEVQQGKLIKLLVAEQHLQKMGGGECQAIQLVDDHIHPGLYNGSHLHVFLFHGLIVR